MHTTVELELDWIRQSEQLEKPVIILVEENGVAIGVRVYSSYNIMQVSIERAKQLRIKIKELETYELIKGKSAIELEGIPFTLVDDCGLQNLIYRPLVVKNMSPIRSELLALFLKYKDKGGYEEELEVLTHYECRTPRIKVRLKKVKRWVEVTQCKSNLNLHNDYYATSQYLQLMLSNIILNRIVNEDHIVKSVYVNTCESKDGLVYHKVYNHFMSNLTADITKILKTSENFANAIIDFCEED